MKYCDFIAANIQSALKETELNVGSIQFDLDEDGAFRSTTKKIFVKDSNGQLYKIQIEEQNNDR
jgi:hypothetical protein